MALHNYIYYKHDDSIADKIARPHDTRPELRHCSSHDSLSEVDLNFSYDDFHNLKIDVDMESGMDTDKRLDELSLKNVESNQSSFLIENNINEQSEGSSFYMGDSNNPLMMNYLSNMHSHLERQYNNESLDNPGSSAFTGGTYHHHDSGNSNSTTNTLMSAHPSGSSTDEYNNINAHSQTNHQHHHHINNKPHHYSQNTPHHNQPQDLDNDNGQDHDHNQAQILHTHHSKGVQTTATNELYNKYKEEYQYNFDEYQTSNFVKSAVVPPITASLPMSVRMTRNSSSKSSVRNSYEGFNDPSGNTTDQSNPQSKKKRKLQSRFSKRVLAKRQGKGIKDVRNNQI